jgi:hypothetical protein
MLDKTTFKNLSRACLPPATAQFLRRATCRLDYRRQMRRCRTAFLRYGERYPQPLLFVAGLPKSGTTWLKKMLSSYPGFHEVIVPEATLYELDTGGSHDFEFPEDLFKRFDGRLVVLKMHAHGSPRNKRLLREAGLPHVVLYRDLRDVAVSHYFYVRRTPWHPEYARYAPLSVEEGLMIFAETLLPDFVAWVRSWHESEVEGGRLIIRYEDLVADTERIFGRVAAHFGLDHAPETIRTVVEAHRFDRMSGGRRQGIQDAGSFFRKGIAGDWRNHFTEPVKAAFKEHGGDFWVAYGYERDSNW